MTPLVLKRHGDGYMLRRLDQAGLVLLLSNLMQGEVFWFNVSTWRRKKGALEQTRALCCGDQPAATVISDVPRYLFLEVQTLAIQSPTAPQVVKQ